MHPWALPRDWQRRQLGDLSNIRYGLGVPPELSDNGVPMIRATNVKRGRICSQGLLRIEASTIPKGKNAFLKQGDIIVVRSGAYTGDSAIITSEWAGSIAGYDLVVSPSSDVESTFLAMWLLSEEFQVHFRGHRDRSAQPHLNRQQLGSAMLPVPPLGEQRQIARVLAAVQRAIERQERLITLTAELKKALMHKLFTEGTRDEPLKQTEIGPMPKSWEIKRIADVCKLVSGGTPSKANAAFWNGPIPWASPKDMKQSRLSDTEDHISPVGLESGSRLAPTGSIFVVIRGMILMRDVPIAQATVPMAFNQDMKALVEHNGVSSDFLLYSLQRAREQLLRKVGSSAHGTRTLMTSAVEQLPIGVPSPSEQGAISQALKVTEAKQSVHQKNADRFREFFRTLLHQLMTAQIPVHNLDLSALDEPVAEAATVT